MTDFEMLKRTQARVDAWRKIADAVGVGLPAVLVRAHDRTLNDGVGWEEALDIEWGRALSARVVGRQRMPMAAYLSLAATTARQVGRRARRRVAR